MHATILARELLERRRDRDEFPALRLVSLQRERLDVELAELTLARRRARDRALLDESLATASWLAAAHGHGLTAEDFVAAARAVAVDELPDDDDR